MRLNEEELVRSQQRNSILRKDQEQEKSFGVGRVIAWIMASIGVAVVAWMAADLLGLTNGIGRTDKTSEFKLPEGLTAFEAIQESVRDSELVGVAGERKSGSMELAEASPVLNVPQREVDSELLENENRMLITVPGSTVLFSIPTVYIDQIEFDQSKIEFGSPVGELELIAEIWSVKFKGETVGELTRVPADYLTQYTQTTQRDIGVKLLYDDASVWGYQPILTTERLAYTAGMIYDSIVQTLMKD